MSCAFPSLARDPEEIELFFRDALQAQCEGLMVKVLDDERGHYEPNKRSLNWFKVTVFFRRTWCPKTHKEGNHCRSKRTMWRA